MIDFAFSDYVMYDGRELGRVIGMRADGDALVCYSTGCTAAVTPVRMLAYATREQIEAVPDAAYIGFHRFDDACPKYLPEVCRALCPDKR